MKKLNYEEIKQVFNNKIFENSKIDLLEKLAKSPNRYVGIFRPTKPRTKIIQNITMSHEIKFGDAFELLIRKSFEVSGYKSLERVIRVSDTEYVDMDQLFLVNDRVVFIEQKVRDDHDSTKKRGQINNFETKINLLIEKYNCPISCYFYFIDDSLCKNKNYYKDELSKMEKAYSLDIKLFYGSELFEKESILPIWDEEIIEFLLKWRKELPDLPELNFDLNPLITFNEIKDLKPLYYRKILENSDILNEIFPIIFPENKTLKLLLDDFNAKKNIKNNQSSVYAYLHDKLSNYLIA